MRGPERDDGKRQQGGPDRNTRREHVKHFIDVRRDDVFFEEHLQAIGQRLQQSKRANAIGAKPVLHVGGDFALRQYKIGDRTEQHRHHGNDNDDRIYEIEGNHVNFTPYSPTSPASAAK